MTNGPVRFKMVKINGWKRLELITIAAVGLALLLMFLWFLAALVFRLRFQFSILALLVLAVVVAVPFSWLATEMKAARKQREAADGIRKVGGKVYYDYHFDPSGYWTPGATPPGPSWLRKLLGDDQFADVTVVSLRARGQRRRAGAPRGADPTPSA